jgi:hypothetical protein
MEGPVASFNVAISASGICILPSMTGTSARARRSRSLRASR